MDRQALYRRLCAAISPEERAALAAGELPVSDFNRQTLLTMAPPSSGAEDLLDEGAVEGLLEAIRGYLKQYLAEKPEAWRWIELSSLYLTFVAQRPMHPIPLLHIETRAVDGQTAYYCPAKSPEADAPCRYCVCHPLQ